MSQYELSYLHILEGLVTSGELRNNERTGVGTYSKFGMVLHHDLAEGFPMLTTKKLHWKSIAHELLWMISGSTNIKYLQENGVTIWDEWADENGDLGPVYGSQWRRWKTTEFIGDQVFMYEIDQLADVIERIKTNPQDRRLIVSAWNVAEVPNMKLPPCHMMYQFYVREGKYLDIQMYQRSADWFLGVPFNMASYALLNHMVAHVTGLTPGRVRIMFGDLHLYQNHVEQALEQIRRTPTELPELFIKGEHSTIDDFKFEDFRLFGYDAQPSIKAPVAV